ncbi:MAG TPA: hypothetical protein VNZ63_14100 [Verrucomicrobiae bacterium]|nr:hypothetical protein [Verrucomicrobiae bacterium]
MGIESGKRQPWPWPDELDALIAAPSFHKNLFENDLVRYLEVIIPPGDFVPVHTHRWPSVIYVRSTSDFIRRDGEGRVMFDSRKAGALPKMPTVEWVGPLPPHSVENVGSSEVHLLTVELKQSRA